MCLLALAWHAHPDHTLVLAGNRDEAHARPSAAADWWADAPDVLGGRDLAGGGTWLAVARNSRFAVVTNHRDLRRAAPPGAPSRGHLVRDFVTGTRSPADFVAALQPEAGRYAGFNLLVGDATTLWYVSNRAPARALAPGRYTLSNATLDEPWPKTRLLADRFDAALTGAVDAAALFAALADRREHPDPDLPDTGLDRARERALSAAHIVGTDYGTRAATLLLVGHDGRLVLRERRFDATGAVSGEDLHIATRVVA